jgi:hypothetical protein
MQDMETNAENNAAPEAQTPNEAPEAQTPNEAPEAAPQEKIETAPPVKAEAAPRTPPPAPAAKTKNKRGQAPLSADKIREIQALNEQKGVTVIVEKCQGCDRTNVVGDLVYCAAFTTPALKWRLGNCNMATHIKVETKGGAEKVRVGQQKQKKK